MKTLFTALLLLITVNLFAQEPPEYYDGTFINLDTLEQSDYFGMYNFADTCNIGTVRGGESHLPGRVTKLLFTDLDSDGHTDIIGGLSFDSHLPEYPVFTDGYVFGDTMAFDSIDYKETISHTAAVEFINGRFEYSRFWSDNSSAPIALRDFDGDGEDDLFSYYYKSYAGIFEGAPYGGAGHYYGTNVQSLDGELKLQSSYGYENQEIYVQAEDFDQNGRMEVLSVKYIGGMGIPHSHPHQNWHWNEYDPATDSLVLKKDLTEYWLGNFQSSAAGDLTGDDYKELVIANDAGHIFVFDKDGVEIDSIPASDDFIYDPHVHILNDIDDNGLNELVGWSFHNGLNIASYEMVDGEFVTTNKVLIWHPEYDRDHTPYTFSSTVFDANWDGYDDVCLFDSTHYIILSWNRINEGFEIYAHGYYDISEYLNDGDPLVDYDFEFPSYVVSLDFGDVNGDNVPDMFISQSPYSSQAGGSVLYLADPGMAKNMGVPRDGYGLGIHTQELPPVVILPFEVYRYHSGSPIFQGNDTIQVKASFYMIPEDTLDWDKDTLLTVDPFPETRIEFRRKDNGQQVEYDNLARVDTTEKVSKYLYPYFMYFQFDIPQDAEPGEIEVWFQLSIDGHIITPSEPMGYFTINTVSSIEDNGAIVKDFALRQNYPNPFNPATTINFDLPESTPVTLTVYNISGRMVIKLLDNKTYHAGSHQVQWDAGSYSSGTYFYRIETSKQIVIKKMMLLK